MNSEVTKLSIMNDIGCKTSTEFYIPVVLVHQTTIVSSVWEADNALV